MRKLVLILIGSLGMTLNSSAYVGEAFTYSYKQNIGYKVTKEASGGNKGEVEVTKGCKPEGAVEIPETVSNNNLFYTVTAVGDEAFYDCTAMTSIKLPTTLKSIGESAFTYCNKLTKLEIPDGVSTIKQYAFYGVSGITTFRLPSSLESIEKYVLLDCYNLETLYIPASVKYIDPSAFDRCEKLTNFNLDEANPYFVWKNSTLLSKNEETLMFCLDKFEEYEIPSTVKTIADYAFSGKYSLKKIVIPSSVVSIGADAFYACSSLNDIIMGENVNFIGDRAFSSCQALTSVTLPEGIETISENMFYFCTVLESVTIPAAVKSIGKQAFYYCKKLTSINIPENVTQIGESAFNNCTAITSVTIPANVTSIGNQAFGECSKLTEVKFNATNCTYCGNTSWNGVVFPANATITVGENVTNIPDAAFYKTTPPIYIMADDLPALGNNAIKNGTKVYVQAKAKKQYSTTTGWKSVPEANVIAALTLTPPEEMPSKESEGVKLDISIGSQISCEGLQWSSDNMDVATVDGNGNLTIKNIGKTTITVEASNGFHDSCTIFVYPEIADANGDGEIDISDAVDIASYVVQTKEIPEGWEPDEWEAFYKRAADLNGDDEITFGDAFSAVLIMFNDQYDPFEKPGASRVSRAYGNESTDALVAGTPTAIAEGRISIPVYLDNSVDYVALQADILLPEGMAVESVNAGGRAVSHGLTSKKYNDRHMRMALFDISCRPFAVSNEPIFEIIATTDNGKSDGIEFGNVIASDSNAVSHVLTTRGSATGVGSVAGASASAKACAAGLLISNASGKEVIVCTTDGTVIRSLIATSDAETIFLPEGLYIVSINGKANKIAIK